MDLELMLRFVNQSMCRREQILSYFNEVITNRPVYCCDQCGFDIWRLEKKKHDDKELVLFNWDKELSRLLPIKKDE